VANVPRIEDASSYRAFVLQYAQHHGNECTSKLINPDKKIKKGLNGKLNLLPPLQSWWTPSMS